MRRLGVIDLGTNTFHLLIVDAEKGKPFREIYRKSTFVQLAEDGIQTIGAAPFQRGLDALLSYQQILLQFPVEDLKIFGTAALRTASNGLAFIQQVKSLTAFEIQLIPGEEEARLIHQGVLQAVPFGAAKQLIIDIGGGSVEFIIADQKQLYWAQSFPIGVAVLYRDYHTDDPISENNITPLEGFLEEKLRPLFDELAKHGPLNLVGASGAFDVLQHFLNPDHDGSTYSVIPVHDFHPFLTMLLPKSLAERYQLEGLDANKAKMIIVALILIDFILRKAQSEIILVSAYALKEGILKEMLEK